MQSAKPSSSSSSKKKKNEEEEMETARAEITAAEAQLPEGFTFQPTDLTLLRYLKRKNSNQRPPTNLILPINSSLYHLSPSQLKRISPLKRVNEAYFFTKPAVRRGSQSWGPTGEEQRIKGDIESEYITGIRKTLRFSGKGNSVITTDDDDDEDEWFVHEYRINEKPKADDWILWKLFQEVDEEEDDDDDEQIGVNEHEDDDEDEEEEDDDTTTKEMASLSLSE